MKTGDSVLISPEVTHKSDWIQGTVIDVEDNPFVGTVISAETTNGDIFFEKECLFKPAPRYKQNTVMTKIETKKEKNSKDCANRFAGAWKDNRSAEEIISDIRECRTTGALQKLQV